VQFGARTSGAVVILGAVLLLIATLFSGSVATLLRLFPTSILGVNMLLTGAHLTTGSCDVGKHKAERFVTVASAAPAV
jgi:xanthine/uracil permease